MAVNLDQPGLSRCANPAMTIRPWMRAEGQIISGDTPT